VNPKKIRFGTESFESQKWKIDKRKIYWYSLKLNQGKNGNTSKWFTIDFDSLLQ
jgi:hypothetical protein